MEVSIGDYGRMMFQMMVGSKEKPPKHWLEIREKAEPLVRELIRLNKVYKLHGYYENGKLVRPTWRRIEKAQKKLWQVEFASLKPGDRVWVLDGDFDMNVQSDDPLAVEFVNHAHAAVNYLDDLRKVRPYRVILKAPEDFREKRSLYVSDEYWLERAEELGF